MQLPIHFSALSECGLISLVQSKADSGKLARECFARHKWVQVRPISRAASPAEHSSQQLGTVSSPSSEQPATRGAAAATSHAPFQLQPQHLQQLLANSAEVAHLHPELPSAQTAEPKPHEVEQQGPALHEPHQAQQMPPHAQSVTGQTAAQQLQQEGLLAEPGRDKSAASDSCPAAKMGRTRSQGSQTDAEAPAPQVAKPGTCTAGAPAQTRSSPPQLSEKEKARDRKQRAAALRAEKEKRQANEPPPRAKTAGQSRPMKAKPGKDIQQEEARRLEALQLENAFKAAQWPQRAGSMHMRDGPNGASKSPRNGPSQASLDADLRAWTADTVPVTRLHQFPQEKMDHLRALQHRVAQVAELNNPDALKKAREELSSLANSMGLCLRGACELDGNSGPSDIPASMASSSSPQGMSMLQQGRLDWTQEGRHTATHHILEDAKDTLEACAKMEPGPRLSRLLNSMQMARRILALCPAPSNEDIHSQVWAKHRL